MKRILGLEPNWVRLVSARISADEDYMFFVSLTRHHSQVQPFEYVRLLLYYYARVLFLFDPANEQMVQSAQGLIQMMRAIFRRRVDADCDVLQRAGIDRAMTLVASEPQKNRREIFTTLYYLSKGGLYLKAGIPKDASIQHMVYSVPAMLQSILPHLDGRSLNVLNYAVPKMQNAYHAGKSFSELRNMSEIPTEAFNSAAKLFGQPPSHLGS
ncbi:MAG: hypothetical protein QME78_10620 [Thermodesulfobacteriota bacterium]|nr:hypothetical protein [Thermodesulfobacteriota bacterium]